MWADLIEFIGTRFDREDYLFWSRISGTLWTVADITIAYYLIRIGNLARAFQKVRLHRFSYAVLLATLPPAAFIPFVQTNTLFFRIELAVTIPHFLIILYVCASDSRVGLSALRRALNEHQPATAGNHSGSES